MSCDFFGDCNFVKRDQSRCSMAEIERAKKGCIHFVKDMYGRNTCLLQKMTAAEYEDAKGEGNEG